MGRGVCSTWNVTLAEAVNLLAPSKFSCRSTEIVAPGGVDSDKGWSTSMLAYLTREAMKSMPAERHTTVNLLLASFAGRPSLQAALHSQIQHHLLLWQRCLGRLVKACPMTTCLDLSSCAVVVSAADVAAMTGPMPALASDSSARAPAALEVAAGCPTWAAAGGREWQHHPCTHAVIGQEVLPLSVVALLELVGQLPCLKQLRIQIAKITEFSIAEIAASLRAAPKLPLLSLSFMLPSAPSTLSHRRHVSGWAVLPMTDSDILQLSCCPAMASINLSDHDQIQDVGVAALAALPQLQAASISATGVTDAGLMLLSESTSLQRLDISRCKNVHDEGFAGLASLTGLTALDVSECATLSDVGLGALVDKLVGLRELNLHGCIHVTDAGLSLLRRCSSLSSLNLAVCREVTDAGLQAIIKLPLRTLDLTFVDRVSDKGISLLTRLTSLQNLTLACCKFTTVGISDLARLSGLTHLELMGCVDGISNGGLDTLRRVSGLISLSLAFCDRMEDEGVEALSTLTTLTELDLTYCRAVTDRGVAALHMLTRLQTLKLQGCGARAPHMGSGLSVLRGMGQLQALTLAGATVTQEGLAALPALASLTSLSLSLCKLRDENVEALTTLTGMQRLELGGNPQLTDAAARHLGSLRSLRDLDLSGIQLTDAGLCSLSQLVFLKRLQITNCPKLTEQGVDALVGSLPGLRTVEIGATLEGASVVPPELVGQAATAS
eukprot:jgi/Astpho2/3360/Aster-x0157